MFTTQAGGPTAYRNLWRTSTSSYPFLVSYENLCCICILIDGLSSVYKSEGIKGLYKGTTLALVGVSNGAIQFMSYEQLKWLCTEQKRIRYKATGREWRVDDEKLVRPIPSFFSDYTDL